MKKIIPPNAKTSLQKGSTTTALKSVETKKNNLRFSHCLNYLVVAILLQLTLQLGFVGNAIAQCNNTFQWPSGAINAGTGSSVTIANNSWEGDYSRLTGITNGATYIFTLNLSGGYITVRAGSLSGTVIGAGVTPLTIVTTSASDLYVHWNTNASCGSATTNRITTVQRLAPSITSLGTTSGCVASSVIINGVNLSNASAVTIGGTNATITSNNSSQITATIGAGTTGTVSVTTPGGVANSASSFTVNALPTVFSVSGGGAYCSGGAGVVISLSGSQIGVQYQLFNGASAVGSLVNGTGSAISFGLQTAAGAYTVVATRIAGGCTVNMTGSASVAINSLPQGSLSGNSICGGGTGQLTFDVISGTGPFAIVYNDGVANRSQSSISSGTAFNVFTNPSVTSNYTLVNVTDNNGCIRNTAFTGGTATITLGSPPTITAASTANAVCFSSVLQNAILAYTATSNSPTYYSISWNAAALAAGFINVTNATLVASPISIVVAANTTAATYTGTLTVSNVAGCVSTGNTFSITVNPLPTITTSANAGNTCSTTSLKLSPLSYSATTNSPTQYSITWNAAALAAGQLNVPATALPASPIQIAVQPNLAGGTYTGSVTVINGNGCSSTGNNFNITVFPAPQGSLTGNTVCGIGTGQLTLTATSGTGPFIVGYNDGVATRTQTAVVSGTPFNAFTNPSITTNYTMTSLKDNLGCTRIMAFTTPTATITVGSLPTDRIPTAVSSTICAGSSTNIRIVSSQTGVNYQLRNNATNALIGVAIAGGGTINLPTGNLAITTVFNVLATEASSGCNAQMSVTPTVTVNGVPTITSALTAANVCFSSGTQNSSLSYTSTTNSPINYTITWNAAALAAGLTNVSSTLLSSSPITIPVAASIATGVYSGTLTVTNLAGCPSTGNSFTLSVDAVPVMTSASSSTLCSGGTVNITLASTLPSSYAWIAAANANVTGENTTLQTSNTLTNTLINITGATQIVSYTVTPTAITGGCVGTSQTVLVTLNPTPATTVTPAAQTICSGNNITSIILNSSISITGTTFSWSRNSPVGISGTVATSGTNVTSGTTIAGTFTNANAVATDVSFTVNSITPAGCPGNTVTATVTVNLPVSITSQAADLSICSGASASFGIIATGSSLSYQWRKGVVNLSNGGNISGATSPTLTITSTTSADNSTDYNCVVTSGSCTAVISDFASLVVNNAAITPAAQPTSLLFPSVNSTSILSTFTASASATNYLVIRKNANVTPTAPTSGVIYTQGTSALTGYVEYSGTANTFTSNGLSPGTTYYYWVYAYNTSTCGATPLYLTTSPLSGNATTGTTVSCGSLSTLYWGGIGSTLTGSITSGTDFNAAANWSTTSPAYTASPVSPTQCNNVSMAFRNNATITLSANASVYNLTYTVAGNNRVVTFSTEGRTLTVNGDAVVDVLSGNTNTSIYIGENSSGAGVVDFKANVRIGETYYLSIVPKTYLIGNINSKITFRGDVLFGRTARFVLPLNASYPPSYPIAAPGTGTTPGTIEFDGIGLQQVLWNNDVWYDNFYNMVVGNQNKPYVRHVTGTYTPDNILNNFTINDGCTVDLATSQWIRESQGGTLTLNGTAKLILGNDKSVLSSAATGVAIAGSNFPGGFSTLNISPTSTIEYNAPATLTQTVYGTPLVGSLTYGNLILSNSAGTGTANKNSVSTITVVGTTNINTATTMTLGAGLVSNGAASVNLGGRLECSTYVVSGNGSFSLQSGGTLGMGAAAGIVSSGATGNVQTTTRTFSTGGNYVYNSIVAQTTGSALPTQMNNLSISNAAGVTMNPTSTNYSVNGILQLVTGPLIINGDSLTIAGLQRTSGTLSGSATSSVGITGTGIPLFFTAGSRILRNLFLNASASASLQTGLDITAGTNAGSLALGSGSSLNTFDNLVLKSDANGTARIAEIPVNAAGTALGTIAGKIQVERFVPAKRGWRLMTVPLQAATAPTFNQAWQEGVVNTGIGTAYNINPNPGFGMHISGGLITNGFDPTPNNNASVKSFNAATATWSGIASTLTTRVTDDQGYMVFVRGNRNTQLLLNTGAPLSTSIARASGNVNTGRQTIAIPSGSGSFSLVGNPFASAINFKNVSTTGSVSGATFVLWDPKLTGSNNVGAFQYFTQLGGAGSDYQVVPGGGSYGSSLSINNFIQSGQAFLLQRSAGSGSVVINENAKATVSSSAVFRPVNNNELGHLVTTLSFIDTDSSITLLDGVLTAFGNNFSDTINNDDVRKMENIAENFGIEKNGQLLQIEKRNAINTADTIFFKMKKMKARNYRLSMSANNIELAGLNAWLQDSYLQTNTALNLSGITDYLFTVINDSGSWNPARFKIVFKMPGVLPMNFSSIRGSKQANGNMLEWTVENETSIDHYEVEKSINGSIFNKVHITPKVENSSSNTYNWLDENATAADNYYRIKSVGHNNSVSHSRIIKLSADKNVTGISIYPNPVTDGIISLQLKNLPAGKYNAKLMNSAGQILKSEKLQHQAGTATHTVFQSAVLPNGNYQLELTGEQQQFKQTIMVIIQSQ